MKLNRMTWIGLGSLAALLGVILFMTLFPTSGESDHVSENDMQSAVARAGDLEVSVSGSGELVPISEISLSFEESGELLALNARVGDQVQAGDVLASLKLDKTEAELVADLAQAELGVLLAQQKLDQTIENTQLDAANALLALEEAQLAVEALQDYELEQAMAKQNLFFAEEAVQEAEMDLYIVNSAPSQQALDTAYASLLFKEKELHDIQDQIAQAEYQFISASNQMVRDRLDQQLKSLRVQLANQQVEYENAFYKYETLDDPPGEVHLSVAEARFATAQAQLAEAENTWLEIQTGPSAGSLAVVEAQLAEAQSEWERLKDGPDPDELELLEAKLAKAELELLVLQDQVLVLDLAAPIDGTVITIESEVGDRVSNETILTLADSSQAMLEVSLDELDQSSVEIGNPVEISFDAIPDQIFHGEVVQQQPSLIGAGNSQALRVWVLLDAFPSDLIKLPLGINAVVDVITGEAQESVLVTIDALQGDVNGGNSVYVLEGESVEQRPVQTGLMDATTAEIVAGLQAGERVLIGNLDMDLE